MLVFAQRASVFLGFFGPFGRFFTGKSIWRELCQPALYFPQMDFMTRISFDTVLGGRISSWIQRSGPFTHAVRLMISVSSDVHSCSSTAVTLFLSTRALAPVVQFRVWVVSHGFSLTAMGRCPPSLDPRKPVGIGYSKLKCGILQDGLVTVSH